MYNFTHSSLLLYKTYFLLLFPCFLIVGTFKFLRSCINWWRIIYFSFKHYKWKKKKNNLVLLSMQAFTNNCPFFSPFVFFTISHFYPSIAQSFCRHKKSLKSMGKIITHTKTVLGCSFLQLLFESDLCL